MGRRQYAEAMVIAGAVYQDIKDTSQNVIYVRSNKKKSNILLQKFFN